MKTVRMLKKTLTALCLLGVTHMASAGIISFNPTPAVGTVGPPPIFVDLVWTGAVNDYIGAFDVQINFDSSVVSLLNAVVDPDAGLDSLGAGIYGFGANAPGLFSFGVSLDSPGDLIANQDGLANTFRLATFAFIGLADGLTDLTFGRTTFADAFGRGITPTLVNGQICVGSPDCVTTVPEPVSLALFGIGLAGLAWSRRKARI